jgi:hypothetical protein
LILYLLSSLFSLHSQEAFEDGEHLWMRPVARANDLFDQPTGFVDDKTLRDSLRLVKPFDATLRVE